MVIFSFYWLYTWSPNLVLFQSRTWKPVKLGSIPILHLKCQSNLILFSRSTYLDLPLATSLVALLLCHAYLLDWTYNSDANQIGFKSNMHLPGLAYHWLPIWLGFEILWKLRFVWIIIFLPEDLSKAFIGCKTLFYSVFLFQIRKHISDAMCECYVMYDLAWMKFLCIRFTFMVFSLLILPPSRPCTPCGPVGAVSSTLP